MNERSPFSALSESDFQKFPDITTYKGNLLKLANIDFSKKNLQEIGNTFYNLATIIPVTFRMMKDSFSKLKLYRVRTNLSLDEDQSLIRTYSYPPIMICNKNGRANLKKKSVFYCCDSAHGAILESKLEVNQTGYLSVWNPNPIATAKAAIVISTSIPETNKWHPIATQTVDFQKNFYNQIPIEYQDHFWSLIAFVERIFVSEKEPYSLTSWIANRIMFGERHNDILIYPGVASNQHYCNLAIHPNTVETSIQFEKVGKFIVREKENTWMKISFGEVGELENNQMIWRKHVNEEFGEKY